MAQTPWKQSLIGSCVAVAIAAAGVGMALTADRNANAGIVPSLQSTSMPQKIWNAAEPFVKTPVRLGTLQESAAAGGHWVDLYAVTTVVDGMPGQLKIARDFGPSEETDAVALLSGNRPQLAGLAIGFRPEGDGKAWSWARYDADGNVLRDTAGYPVTAQFTLTDPAQCVAYAWMEMVPTG